LAKKILFLCGGSRFFFVYSYSHSAYTHIFQLLALSRVSRRPGRRSCCERYRIAKHPPFSCRPSRVDQKKLTPLGSVPALHGGPALLSFFFGFSNLAGRDPLVVVFVLVQPSLCSGEYLECINVRWRLVPPRRSPDPSVRGTGR